MIRLWINIRSYSSGVSAVKLKPASSSYKQSKIIDKIRVYVRGGSGGQGCPSTGGIGATGGNVFVKCTKGASLKAYGLQKHRRIIAEHGLNYEKGQMKLRQSKNSFIVVPPGTEVRSGKNVLIHDMNFDGDIIKIARGGYGGSAKTKDFNGLQGERKNITLELKSIADVALTGFPNAGKSSLLRLLSRARPKVGNYPFTTINPMVGSIFYSDGSQVGLEFYVFIEIHFLENNGFIMSKKKHIISKTVLYIIYFSLQISVADLPGLIEDAHLNKGMGHRFLRHTERTNLITLVVDIEGFQLKSTHPFRSPIETIILLLKELLLYQDLILDRSVLLVLNKMDVENAEQKKLQILEELAKVKQHPLIVNSEYAQDLIPIFERLCHNNFENVFPVSSITGYGADELKNALYDQVPRRDPSEYDMLDGDGDGDGDDNYDYE